MENRGREGYRFRGDGVLSLVDRTAEQEKEKWINASTNFRRFECINRTLTSPILRLSIAFILSWTKGQMKKLLICPEKAYKAVLVMYSKACIIYSKRNGTCCTYILWHRVEATYNRADTMSSFHKITINDPGTGDILVLASALRLLPFRPPHPPAELPSPRIDASSPPERAS